MVVLALLLLAMLCLPVITIRCARGSGEAGLRSNPRMTMRNRLLLRRLDRRWDGVPADRTPPSPAIEFLAADLRRLYRHRLGIATQSLVWHIAILRAYDARLRLASHCLGVQEHLDTVSGMDLEIERLRIESELEAAGLVLRAPG